MLKHNYYAAAGWLLGLARYHSQVKVQIRSDQIRSDQVRSVEQFHGSGRLSKTLEPLESVVDKDPVLVRLASLTRGCGWKKILTI